MRARLALTQDWFTIYHSNSVHLGKIDAEISREIIVAYSEIKRLIEDFNINNDYLTVLEQVDSKWQSSKQDALLIGQREHIHNLMKSQYARIKKEHSQCQKAVEAVKKVLADRGVIN